MSSAARRFRAVDAGGRRLTELARGVACLSQRPGENPARSASGDLTAGARLFRRCGSTMRSTLT